MRTTYTQYEREQAVNAFPFTEPHGLAMVHVETLRNAYRHLHDKGRYFYDKSLQDAGVIIQKKLSELSTQAKAKTHGLPALVFGSYGQ